MIRVKSLTLRLLMSYINIYIYDISSLRVKLQIWKPTAVYFWKKGSYVSFRNHYPFVTLLTDDSTSFVKTAVQHT